MVETKAAHCSPYANRKARWLIAHHPISQSPQTTNNKQQTTNNKQQTTW